MREQPRKFETLDALRGLASVLVVMHHFPLLFGHHNPPGVYLAVDFFFSLSGFVMSFAYQARLDGGLPTWKFLLTRFVRLWPIYLLGIVVGECAPYYAGHYAGARPVLLNALFLPSWSKDIEASLFPVDGPTWTLFFELLANAVHGVWLRRLRSRTLAIVCAIAGIALGLGFMSYHTIDAGWSEHSLLMIGVPRVLFPYTLGMLVYRLWKERFRSLRVPATVSCLLLIVTLLIHPPDRFSPAVLAFTLTVMFPVILLLGACSEPHGRSRRSFTVLGIASYAIYVLHEPFGILFERYWPFRNTAIAEAPWSGLLFLASLISMSVWLDKYYDIPVRKKMRQWLQV